MSGVVKIYSTGKNKFLFYKNHKMFFRFERYCHIADYFGEAALKKGDIRKARFYLVLIILLIAHKL